MTGSNRNDFLSIVIIKYAVNRTYRLPGQKFIKVKNWLAEYAPILSQIKNEIGHHQLNPEIMEEVQEPIESEEVKIMKMYCRSVVQYNMETDAKLRTKLLRIVKNFERTYKLKRPSIGDSDYLEALQDIKKEEREKILGAINDSIREIVFLQDLLQSQKFQKGQSILQVAKRLETKHKKKANSLIKKFNDDLASSDPANEKITFGKLIEEMRRNGSRVGEYRKELLEKESRYLEELRRIPKELACMQKFIERTGLLTPRCIYSSGFIGWNEILKDIVSIREAMEKWIRNNDLDGPLRSILNSDFK
jgi:hypothetical protein